MTLSAVSPVSAVSCARCVFAVDDDEVPLVAAPASVAPPAASAETVAIAVSVLREVSNIGGFLRLVVLRGHKIDGQPGRTSGSP